MTDLHEKIKLYLLELEVIVDNYKEEINAKRAQ